MREAIKLFKYNGMRGILRGFSLIINRYLKDLDLVSLRVEAVVPIPLHPKRLKERGFNQAEDLAVVIARHLEVEVGRDYLVRTKHTLPQTRLKKKDREKNIKGAFVVRKKIKRKRILLTLARTPEII